MLSGLAAGAILLDAGIDLGPVVTGLGWAAIVAGGTLGGLVAGAAITMTATP